MFSSETTTSITKPSSANALDEFAFCYALCERLRLKSNLVLQKTHTEAKRMYVLDAKQITSSNK